MLDPMLGQWGGEPARAASISRGRDAQAAHVEKSSVASRAGARVLAVADPRPHQFEILRRSPWKAVPSSRGAALSSPDRARPGHPSRKSKSEPWCISEAAGASDPATRVNFPGFDMCDAANRKGPIARERPPLMRLRVRPLRCLHGGPGREGPATHRNGPFGSRSCGSPRPRAVLTCGGSVSRIAPARASCRISRPRNRKTQKSSCPARP